jgi:predicted 2-oxoglutarate/Fe(II)-dependent dioxygenase YbiX
MIDARRIDIANDRIWTVDGLCGADECDDLVRLAESRGFEAAPITTSRGFVMAPDIRNNTRVILDDVPRAAALWDRVARWVPARIGRHRAVGLNERFRFYRYTRGQQFDWHRDGAFHRSDVEYSLLTFMIYLNDGCEGGATEFEDHDSAHPLRVTPARGMALLFHHPLVHRGAPVRRGVKYVLRSDVMYRRDET